MATNSLENISRIRPLRRLRRLTQAALAAKVGLCEASIRNIEKGSQRPAPETLKQILDVLAESRPEKTTNTLEGARLRDSRLAAGLSIDDVAELADVNRNTVWACEHYGDSTLEVHRASPRPALIKINAAIAEASKIICADEVRQQRVALLLTRPELAKKAGVGLRTLASIEDGEGAGSRFQPALRKLHDYLARAKADGQGDPKPPSGGDLRKQRLALGLSVEKLAELTGVSQQTIRTAESERREPHFRTLRAIAQALGNAGKRAERKTAKVYPRASRSAKARCRAVNGESKAAAPETNSTPRGGCPVCLGTLKAPLMIRGKEKQPLPPAKRRVIEALVKVWPEGLTKDELTRQANCSEPHKLLKELTADTDWKGVLELPGRGYRSGYRIGR